MMCLRVGGSCPYSEASAEVGCWLGHVRIGIRTAQRLMPNLVDPNCSPPPQAMPYDVPVWLDLLPREGGPGHSPANSLVVV